MSAPSDRSSSGGPRRPSDHGEGHGAEDWDETPTDPQPETTPGLEAGGGVAPGDTPPIESGTAGLSSPEARLPSRRNNAAIAIAIVVVLIAIGLALLAVHWPL